MSPCSRRTIDTYITASYSWYVKKCYKKHIFVGKKVQTATVCALKKSYKQPFLGKKKQRYMSLKIPYLFGVVKLISSQVWALRHALLILPVPQLLFLLGCEHARICSRSTSGSSIT
jgi:hypothetical protein